MPSTFYLVKRPSVHLAYICLIFLLVQFSASITQGKDSWTKVQSENFVLVGNASERDIREVAVRLEQFRDAFSRLLTGFRINSSAATRVVVFKSNDAFDPFKPVYQGKPGNVAGYFQSGEDVNYITLTTEELADDPFRVIFHEYVHLLLHNTVRNVPPWLDEGLAEYYSTFDTADDGRKVLLGKVIPGHLLMLRSDHWLPLQTLLSVDRKSPYYNERDKTGIFYAESWALVHYLILGSEGKRLPQLGRFLSLIDANVALDSAFKQAFQMEVEALEKEFKKYVEGHTFRMQIATFERKLEFDRDMTAAPLTEAAAQGYLGDLLLHVNRLSDADARLQQALTLDPQLTQAQASLHCAKRKLAASSNLCVCPPLKIGQFNYLALLCWQHLHRLTHLRSLDGSPHLVPCIWGRSIAARFHFT